MSQAIITRRGGSGSGKVFTPLYTGAMNLVYTNSDQTGGYAEFTSSGTLTWLTDPPDETDLFCVGGGGAGGVGYSRETSTNYRGWCGGGGGGYTTTVTAAALEASTEVTIGAGGQAGQAGYQIDSIAPTAGGTTSIGSLCTAAGGNPASGLTAGTGGSGGGAGSAMNSSGGGAMNNGGSNGSAG